MESLRDEYTPDEVADATFAERYTNDTADREALDEAMELLLEAEERIIKAQKALLSIGVDCFDNHVGIKKETFDTVREFFIYEGVNRIAELTGKEVCREHCTDDRDKISVYFCGVTIYELVKKGTNEK